MMRDEIEYGSGRRITKSLKIELEVIISDALDFLEEHLVELPVIYRENLEGVDHLPEESITSLLLDILANYADGKPYRFDKEIRQNITKHRSPRADLGIKPKKDVIIEDRDRIIVKEHKFYKSFFNIEAKRLTTEFGKDREKEYLVGKWDKGKYIDSGGMERFKKCIYSKDDELAGILGYVQEKDFTYWHNKINTWVDELIREKNFIDVVWTEKDKLVTFIKSDVEKNQLPSCHNSSGHTDKVINKSGDEPIVARYQTENQRTGGDFIVLHHLWVKLC